MQIERLEPGRPASARLVGAVLTRDVRLPGRRLDKGHRLTRDELDAVVAHVATGNGPSFVNVVILETGDVHEDDAAVRLAHAIGGPNLALRGPAESRVDLVADAAGIAEVEPAALERLNRIDPVEIFTVLDGQVVAPGDLVASIKVAPHVVREAVVSRAEARARRSAPIAAVAAFRPVGVAVIATERLATAARERFEASVREKVESLGSNVVTVCYVEDTPGAVASAFADVERDARVGLILTAGAASTDPRDAVFVALRRRGGRVVRRGAPAHPGSMLWLGRLGSATVLGLPSCGAFSKATAADLVLPRLLAGQPPTRATIARLGYGGILSRDMRFRVPPYARRLDNEGAK